MSTSPNHNEDSPQTYQAVSPIDVVRGYNSGAMSLPIQPAVGSETRTSSDTTGSSVKSPRTTRFAEATSVHSPVDPHESRRSPFMDPPSHQAAHPTVSDVGFGYVAANDPATHASQYCPPASPLKSALKSPGTPGRMLNPLSPTFREEFVLEKQEKATDKVNEKDLRVKVRVRVAKILLRFVNFGCSLIVLVMLSTSLTIFETTKSLPPRNNLPAWAMGTNPWAQYLLLGLACFSLFTCLVVFYGYWKGGHRRAEKVAVYYSVFAVCYFVFSLVMWVVAASIYQNSKATGNGQDMWGWSCKQNVREQYFSNTIDYALLCRLQDWGLVCAIIEVIIEVLVILIYVVVFYRFYSKRRLAKTMDLRDRARSDLYLAQLRIQSAPNTPGFPRTPKSPFVTTSTTAQPDYGGSDIYSVAENGEAPTTYVTQYASPRSPTHPPVAFQLKAPPIRIQHATPKLGQDGFSPVTNANAANAGPVPHTPASPPPPPGANSRSLGMGMGMEMGEHMGAAPGERTYEAVPIPAAYASTSLASPGFAPSSSHHP